LANIKIREYDRRERTIIVKDLPAFDNVIRCEVVVLTSPTPFVYRGTIHKHGYEKMIRLYREDRRENRKESRYNVDFKANIAGLIYDGKIYPMLMPIDVSVLNISRGGLRFRSAPNAFAGGNRFKILMMFGDDHKTLTAEVSNCPDPDAENADFGCRLIGMDGRPV
jgi:hypothetical protein